MIRMIIALFLSSLLVLTVTGCGDGPGAVVEANVDAMNRRDYGTIYENFASSSPVVAEYSRDEYLDVAENELGISSDFALADFEIIEEDVRGDNAMVSWRAVVRGDVEGSGPISDVTILVKEDGDWKVVE